MTNKKDVEDFLIYKEGRNEGHLYEKDAVNLEDEQKDEQECSICACYIIWKRPLTTKQKQHQWICPLCKR